MRKKVIVCIISLMLVMSNSTLSFATPIDVQHHWSGTAVNTLIENNIMVGYKNGRFKPDHSINREEVAVIFQKLLEINGESGLVTENEEELNSATFKDTKGRWSESAINTLTSAKILNGYPDGTFRPENLITREEFAMVVENYRQFISNRNELTESAPVAPQSGETSKDLEKESTKNLNSENKDLSLENFTPPESNTGTANKSEPGNKPESNIVVPENNDLIALGNKEPGINEQDNKNPANSESNAAEPKHEGTDTDNPAASVNELMPEPGVPAASENEPGPDVKKPEIKVKFSDISGSFAFDAITKLCADEVLSGYPDGTFRPGNKMTRAEAASVIYEISELSPINPIITLPLKNVIDVPYISQVWPVRAMVGCEGASMLMGLKGKGYAENVDLRKFLDDMPKHSSNPAKGFVGSPYKPDPTKKTRTTIYPPILAEYSNKYGKVWDISMSSIHELQSEILAGNPVVAYVTLWWEKPYYRYYNIEGTRQRLLSNNHAVLVCGYDKDKKAYYIADPYNVKNTKEEYRYWVKSEIFDRLYNERRHALSVE